MREWPRRFRNDEIAGVTSYELDKEIYLSIYLSIRAYIRVYIRVYISSRVDWVRLVSSVQTGV